VSSIDNNESEHQDACSWCAFPHIASLMRATCCNGLLPLLPADLPDAQAQIAARDMRRAGQITSITPRISFSQGVATSRKARLHFSRENADAYPLAV